MSRIRLLLVDDSVDFIESATRFLSTDPDIQVAGCALQGSDAVRLVTLLRPDLVLMDWAMPGMSGLDATRAIKAQANPPRVVMLTLLDNAEYRAAAESAKADGYVAKPDLAVDLIPLIHVLCPDRTDRDHDHNPTLGSGAVRNVD